VLVLIGFGSKQTLSSRGVGEEACAHTWKETSSQVEAGIRYFSCEDQAMKKPTGMA
jgi:hypothetical protein